MKTAKIWRITPILALLCLLIVIVAPAAFAAPVDAENLDKPIIFKDISNQDALYPFVRFLSEKALIQGFPDGSFKPEGMVTRAEMAAIVVKTKNISPKTEGNPSFSDVSKDHWAYGAIESALDSNLLQGYPDGTFMPDRVLSRAEALTILIKLSGGAFTDKAVQINDLDSGHWAYKSVATAVDAGIVSLSSEGMFNPEVIFQRGDLARGLSSVINLGPALREADLTGRLTVKTGVVTLVSNNISQIVTGEALIGSGFTIITDSEGTADLTFDDGSGILINENTNIEITESKGLTYMRPNGSVGTMIDKLDLNLSSGEIFGALASRYDDEAKSETDKTTAVKNSLSLASAFLPGDLGRALAAANNVPWWQQPSVKRERVVVNMPWGVAGIRGTFWNNMITQSGQTTILLTGSATVSSGGVTTSLIGGQQTLLTSASAPPAPPAPMPPAAVQNWSAVTSWVEERANLIQNSLPPTPSQLVLPPPAQIIPVFMPNLLPIAPPSIIVPPVAPLPLNPPVITSTLNTILNTLHNTVNNLPSQPPAPPGNNGNNGHNSNNSPPAALEVTINGTAAIGETLTADYIYLDPEHNPEGNTIFAWYRGTIQDGSDKTVIQASVEDQYTVTQDDLDKYLFVQVTPVAHSGSLVGQPVLSPATELVVSVADAEIVSYRIVTQQDPDGPTFDFNSLVEDDTAEYYSHTDDDFIEIPIGFDFSFYNGTYNQVFVSTNGYLTFGEGSDEYSNYSFPSTGSPIIAPFFDDLIANQETAGVYYKVIGSEPNRKLVVQWYLEDQYEETPNTVDLQAILFEGSNEILFLYNDTTFGTEDDNGASATIGISLGDGETALQLSYNAASVFDQDVILLTPGSLLAPSDLEVSSNSDLDGIYNELLWDDSPSQGLLYYTVKRNTINSLLNAETLADTIPGGSQAYSDFTAEPGQTYYYFVQVTDGSEIITSNCIEVTTSEENPGDNENIVTFNDAYLEEEIREQLEIPEAEITVEDMANLSYLSMVESDVSDLTGLEYAVNLGTLVISCTPLEDISALAGLANLVELDLSYNNIVDISDLGGLTNLQYLDLSHNAISDISALAGLVNLIELDFSHNQVMDITPLLANEGFGAGDTIDLTYNNLDPYSNEIGILVNTGATVYYLEQNFEAH